MANRIVHKREMVAHLWANKSQRYRARFVRQFLVHWPDVV